MAYSYNRIALKESALAKVFDQYWNILHDFEADLENAAHEYDIAASYDGMPGEREASSVLKAINEAKKAIENVSRANGPLDKAWKADQDFTRKHGTPEDYADEVRAKIYPR